MAIERMATGNNQQFYIQALLALKQAGEQAPIGSDARLIYSTKANSLRNILKTQFGMTNIDADYGAGVTLANTPGGGKIDWNVLSNAADILGTSQAGSTRSAFDRALGEYLTRNLPVWQKASATQPASVSSTITNTTPSNLGGTGAAQAIVGGGNITPTGPSTAIGVGGVGGTGSSGTATSILPTGADTTPTNWKVGDVVPPGYQASADGQSIVKQNITGVNVNSVYGQFIQSVYFKNNDFLGWATQQGVNLPFTVDASGKKSFDLTNATGTQLTWYNNNFKIWNDVQTLSKEQLTLADPASIESNPAFIAQVNVLTADVTASLTKYTAEVDAKLAELAGSQEAAKVGLGFEINTIKGEISAANWRSRQSLAASGMAFSGMLGYLYGQNGSAGMNQINQKTAITAAELTSLGNQMAILTGSKLKYASDLDVLKTGQVAALRAKLIDPSNTRWQEIYDGVTEKINTLTGEVGTAGVQFEAGARGTAAAVATAASEDAKWWITMTVNALDKGISVVRNADGSVSLTQVLSQKWLENGIVYDPKAGTLTHKMTPSEAETNRHNLETEKIGKMNGDTSAAVAAETTRHNKVTEGISQQNVNTALSGAKTGVQPNGYNPDADYTSLKSGNTPPAVLGLAGTRLTAGLGAVSSDTLNIFLNGTTYYWDAVNGKYTLTVPLLANGKPDTAAQTVKAPGLLGLTSDKAQEILGLIGDPVMAIEAATSYEMIGSTSYVDAVDNLMSHYGEVNLSNEQKDALAQWVVASYPIGTATGTGYHYDTKTHTFVKG
jgi:hypothetical protein